MSNLQQIVMMGPADDLLRAEQVRGQQARMNRKGKNEQQREDDEGQPRTDALDLNQQNTFVHSMHSLREDQNIIILLVPLSLLVQPFAIYSEIKMSRNGQKKPYV